MVYMHLSGAPIFFSEYRYTGATFSGSPLDFLLYYRNVLSSCLELKFAKVHHDVLRDHKVVVQK